MIDICLFRFKRRLRIYSDKICAFFSGLFSRTFLYSLYFNFRYLPLHQAKHLPFIIYDTKVYGRPKVFIDAPVISFGMIRIGRLGSNVWNNSRMSSLTFWGEGKAIFKGSCKLTNAIHIRLLDSGVLEIGDSFYASSNLNLHCAESVSFGDHVTLGWDVLLMDTDYHKYYLESAQKLADFKRSICIGSNCWIGTKSLVLKGTSINDHTIVGAGSVVSGHFSKSHIIIKGNPAVECKEGVSIKEDLFW